MAGRSKAIEPSPAKWDAPKSLRTLEAQLSELQKFKGTIYRDMEQQEAEWSQLTKMIFTNAFASDSTNHQNLFRAENSGEHYFDMSANQLQYNFTQRTAAYETCLKSAIAGLRSELPDAEIAGTYNSGDPFSFYKDLKSIVRGAAQQFLLVDPYLDSQLFELYLRDMPSNIGIRVLTNDVSNAVESVARLFAASRTNFELRISKTIHDRIVFIDQRCWAIGQSIKDAATRRPTYIVEIDSASHFSVYEAMWSAATSAVKS